MKLNSLILLNWGTLPDRTFDFVGTSALTGETGAGKTSVIDAMITVMTGGSSRLGRLNSASDDGKGARKRDAIYRTIEGYILGGHNKLFARETAYSYVALLFVPEDHEKSHARPFTAVLAASAVQRKSKLGAGDEVQAAELQEVFYLVVDGALLTMADFLVSDSGKRREVVPVEAIGKHLKDQYPGRKTGIEISLYRRDQHADYLRRLYGALEGRGEVSLERAQAQATVWSRFVGQENIDDISQFIRQFVLPAPTDFAELKKISDGVRASKRLNEQAKLVLERLGLIEGAIRVSEGYGERAISAKSYECAAYRRAYNDANEASKRTALSAQQSRRKHQEALAAIQTLDEQRHGLRDQEVEIRARLKGVESFQRAEQLREAVGIEELKYASCIESIRSRGELFHRLCKSFQSLNLPAEVSASHKALSALLTKAFQAVPDGRVLSQLAEVCAVLNPKSRSTRSLQSLLEESTPIEQALDQVKDILCGEGRPLTTEASGAIERINTSIGNAKREIAEKKEDVSRIEHGNSVSYPRTTKDTLEYLRARISKAQPEVLCDLVTQVRDETWQNAIEGYLGGSRFYIVVKPDFEPEVNVLLEARRREGRHNASVVQGALALKDMQEHGSQLPPDSIVLDLVVDNPYAKAFLYRSYGQVIKVRSAADIHKVPRGVTKDGRGSGSYRTFDAYAESGDLTFGKRAREKRREKRLQEIAVLDAQLAMLNHQVLAIAGLAQVDKLFEALQGLSVHVQCANAISALGEISRLHRQLEAIDLTASKDLQSSLQSVVEKLEQLEKKRDGKVAEAATHEKLIQDYLRVEIQEAGNAMRFENNRQTATQDLGVLAAQAPWVDGDMIQVKADEIAYDPAESVESLHGKKNAEIAKLNGIFTSVLSALGQYNQSAATAEETIDTAPLMAHEPGSAGAFTAISKAVTRAHELESAHKNSQLAKLNVEIDATSRTLRSAFSAHFCNRLLKELEKGDATLRELNAELHSQEFGRDVYKFQVEWSSDTYKDRFAFFLRIREKTADENFDMFAEGALEKQDVPIRDEILALFLEAAEEGGRAALMQVADYRQYRRYDLLKVMRIAGKEHESSVSQQLTDSGGEKETGLFVARVATVTGGLGLREGGPHLRTVVIDELFKKTDEPRIRTAIDYLTKIRQLHVIFAMPTRAIGPFKDIIDSEYAITRMPSTTMNGQLDHFVHVEQHIYNKEEVVRLRKQKSAEVRKQAQLEFEAREREEAST